MNFNKKSFNTLEEFEKQLKQALILNNILNTKIA